VKLTRAFNISKLTKTEFDVLREMMLSGRVSPVIDRTYKLSDTRAALRYLEEGHAKGKAVIIME
jgi:NADPH:quinone reductase-like Zn-dependent oxidoreductase